MKNDIVRAKCIDISVDGFGIAKYNGLVIFVKGMIPGELADIKIISEKKNYSIGIIDKLIEKSKYRIESECPISYKCGGCDFRYIDYEHQLELKHDLLLNTFKDYKVSSIIADDDPIYYRNKVQVPIRDGKIGFYRKFSNDIVEFDDCLIESKQANQIIKDLKRLLIERNIDMYFRHIIIKHAQGTDEIMLGFVVNDFSIDLSDVVKNITSKYSNIKSVILNLNDKDTNVILGDKEKVLFGNDYINDIYDGIKVKLSLKSFYQVNYNQMLKLYSLIYKLSNVSCNDNVLDLFCGIGTISLYLARYAKHVTGVEIVKQAIDNAKENAMINNLTNVDLILADANKNMDSYLIDKDIVIIDPPRKGLSNDLIQTIIDKKINRIVYVSCNPATLARDLELFSNYYNIGDIYPIDMFPFTTHVESVVLMSRADR